MMETGINECLVLTIYLLTLHGWQFRPVPHLQRRLKFFQLQLILKLNYYFLRRTGKLRTVAINIEHKGISVFEITRS